MGNIFKSNEKDKMTPLLQTRTFSMNSPEEDYATNEVKSTSNNIITFVPLNIIHQLRSIANVYFIIIAILQTIPSISVTHGRPTTLVPLSLVMLTVLLKDAYEEFQRYLKDRAQNNRETEILGDSGFRKDRWESIKVGHVIKIKQDQLIPCDAVILYTSHPANKFFLQTKSLDGETNLKVRISPPFKFDLKELPPTQLSRKNYKFQTQGPNHFLHLFEGNMDLEGEHVSLSIDNLVLRGCHLRNVAQAVCVCVFSGSDTKVVLNGAKFNLKTSKLMVEINKMIVSIFIWQVVIAMVLAIFNTLFEAGDKGVTNYIERSSFWMLTSSWWLLMTYFVPISLMVTMEMVKLFQGIIIGRDSRGYVQQYNSHASANNTSVNENLGQIRYIFTDKTGTLTRNQMNFKKLIVNGVIYGDERTISPQQLKSRFPKTTNVDFRDAKFIRKLNQFPIQDVLKVIYLCHDVFVDNDKDGQMNYNSSSPDQIALINFAKLCGYQMMGEQRGFIKIFDRRANTIIKYQKLAFLEFNSDRKKMSVVIRNPNGDIEILTKGADSAILQILGNKSQNKVQTQSAVDRFSNEGLRTLLLAKKKLTDGEYKDWRRSYDSASVSINNRQEKLAASYQLIENNLQLVGGTAVEDRLQDFVKQTIQAMKAAGLKFYILTGDKKQTAISIGRSSGLIEPGSTILDIPDFTQQNRMEWIEWFRKAKEEKGQKIYLLNASKPLPPEIPLHQTICYRCTPAMKENIVRYVKDKTPELTLAIGDGANDVNMIAAADVGVGVKGKEGTQATRVADYVVGQYSLLAFLTLYYGRQWYKRNCRLVSYSFFKNWFHVAAVIVFGAYTFFSASIIFDIYLYELYNVLFVSVPIVIYAVFDEEFTLAESMRFPSLYQPGLSNKQFNQTVYHKSIGRGALYGFISLVIVFMMIEDNVLSENGRMGYLAQSGAVLFASIIINANLRILVITTGITPFSLFAVFGSIVFYWFSYYALNKLLETQLNNSFIEEFTTIPILLVHLILISLITVIDYAYEKYSEFNQKIKRLKYVQNITKGLVDRLLMGQSFGGKTFTNDELQRKKQTLRAEQNGNFIGKLFSVQDSRPKNRRMVPQ